MTPQEIDIHDMTEQPVSGLLPPIGNSNPAEPSVPLFAQNDAQDFRSRWERIQSGFVDEPRKAVEQADQFAAEGEKLESAWDRTDNVSTEDLRSSPPVPILLRPVFVGLAGATLLERTTHVISRRLRI